ncbi:uncharacterized protein [Arachis hypogaea]|uniref:uncharacterized protein n=1 Tax=Arachis hypogaea TaxID=3818 RepID=UPI000DEC5DF7|nr:uncharacterized protein LOC112803447 [Arachis hypogaea]
MKILMWNCRGLGRPLTVHNLKGIIRSHSPEIVFLCETKNPSRSVEQKLRGCGFKDWSLVNPEGTAGGLVIAWKEGLEVTVINSNHFFIAIIVKDKVTNHDWCLLGVHLSTNDQIRSQQFGELSLILQQVHGEVAIIGDFNTITNQREKKGRNEKSPASMACFNNFFNDCELVDIGMIGRPFTWSNRRTRGDLIQERLDRVLAGNGWLQKYQNAAVLRLSESGSDHAPLLLDTNLRHEQSKRRFKFQEQWCAVPEVQNIIQDTWRDEVRGSPMYSFAQKLKKCRHRLVA